MHKAVVVLFFVLALVFFRADVSADPQEQGTNSNPLARAPQHTNRLSKSKSPYLLQHAHNPVDWYPWGEEAFKRARLEDKPIFLSVGYSTCHWCHVMADESFENRALAKFLNEHFICIESGSRGTAGRG